MKQNHWLLRAAEQAPCTWKAPCSSAAVDVVAEVRALLCQGPGKDGAGQHPGQQGTTLSKNQRRRCGTALLTAGAEAERRGGASSGVTEPWLPESCSRDLNHKTIHPSSACMKVILLMCASSVWYAGNYNLIRPVTIFLEKQFFHFGDINTLLRERHAVQTPGWECCRTFSPPNLGGTW